MVKGEQKHQKLAVPVHAATLRIVTEPNMALVKVGNVNPSRINIYQWGQGNDGRSPFQAQLLQISFQKERSARSASVSAGKTPHNIGP